jgi:hypothetical protein
MTGIPREAAHDFLPDKGDRGGFRGANHAKGSNFTAANPSCPPLVRGRSDKPWRVRGSGLIGLFLKQLLRPVAIQTALRLALPLRRAEPPQGQPCRITRTMTEFLPPWRKRTSFIIGGEREAMNVRVKSLHGSALFQPACGQDGRVPGQRETTRIPGAKKHR